MDRIPAPWQQLVVTGASSGIGLALTRQVLQRSEDGKIIAVCRRPEGAESLQALASAYPGRLHCEACDLAAPEQIDALAARIASAAPCLDGVVQAAGLLHGPGIAPEKSLQQLHADSLQRSFALNAFAPVLLLKALLPQLRTARRALFASLSARVGSIADNRLGGWYSYRAAKAAQNQLLKTAAIELRRSAPGVCVVMLHPGTVDTPLSAPFQRGVPASRLFSPERAAAQLLGLLLRLQPEDSGRFLAWDGRELPW